MKTAQYTPNKAVKCQENGVKFDSLLELKYARFFTACGFEWEREPIQFVNWRPDFRVKVGEQSYLIEVKPDYSFFDVGKTELALKQGHVVVLLPNTPLSAITFCWKGAPKSFRDALPENAHELWEEVQNA
jgi:hypothetical protein